MNLKQRSKQLKQDIPALYLVMKSSETPILAKILAFLTIAYALSPIDLIPDFIPVLGYLDDLVILPMLIVWTIKCIPKPVWQKAQNEAQELIATTKLIRCYIKSKGRCTEKRRCPITIKTCRSTNSGHFQRHVRR